MKKYLNPVNYGRMVTSLVNKHFLGRFESLFTVDFEAQLRHPPIFFLGAPRSGSTLAFQVITETLDIGYMSNRHCQWFGAPVLAEKLFHPLANRPSSNYQSKHGVTEGWHAPSECGEWWYRFFRRKPPYMRLDEVDPKKMRALRRSIAALTNAFDRPIVFKNLYASLRIQAIAKYIPESLFVVIHRDEVDNGHSLLEARYKRFGSYDPWFSVEPPDINNLINLPAHQQVIEQIRHTLQTIDSDMGEAGIHSERRFDINYESFCDQPKDTVEAFQQFLSRNGVHISSREVNCPDYFERRTKIRIDENLYEELINYARSTLNQS